MDCHAALSDLNVIRTGAYNKRRKAQGRWLAVSGDCGSATTPVHGKDTDGLASPSPITPRRRFRRTRLLLWTAAALGAVGVMLYAVSTPLLTMVGEQLVYSDPLERVDAMVVLASGTDRIIQAATLYGEGYAPLVVLTTDPTDPANAFLRSHGIETRSSEERRRQLLQALDVPPEAIVVLPDVIRSTADEARVFAEWSREQPIRSVMIVTSPAHSARSRLTFAHALQDQQIRLLVRPSTLDEFRSDTWWRSRDTLREAVIEWQKLVYYRLFEL